MGNDRSLSEEHILEFQVTSQDLETERGFQILPDSIGFLFFLFPVRNSHVLISQMGSRTESGKIQESRSASSRTGDQARPDDSLMCRKHLPASTPQ